MAKASRWLRVFEEFTRDVRIKSKEQTSKDERGVPFAMWDSQKRYMRQMAEGLDDGIHNFIWLKGRQQGVTTISLLLDVFWVATHRHLDGAIVTEHEGNRDKNRDMIRHYINSFPPGYFGDDFYILKGKDNIKSMGFSNGSSLRFLVAGTKKKSIAWAEGSGYALAHATEVASYYGSEGLSSFEESLAKTNPDRLLIYESPLALDTPIPVPGGWKIMADVHRGDIVFNEDGKPCHVDGESEVFHGRKCYRVTFDNGDSIVADARHKWRVSKRRYEYGLVGTGSWHEYDTTTEELRPGLDVLYVTEPLSLPEIELPIDPYLLGVWLGDGDTNGARVTAAEEDLAEMCVILESRGHVIGSVTRSKNRAPTINVSGVRSVFIKHGLLGRKHIPVQYLRASERQRRMLLAGLMDTDGFVHKTSYQCNFTSTNLKLLGQVAELLSSLGIKYVESLNSAEGKTRLFPQGHISVCKESRRLLFSEIPDRRVFNLSRKRRVCETVRRQVWRKVKRLGIVSVVEVPSVPVKCIAVDTPSHLFLAGRTMVPTHNTAKGINNVMHDRWTRALDDPLTWRANFIGWWANPHNAFGRGTPHFAEFGRRPRTREEREMIEQVLRLYDHEVTPEQLCWYRWAYASAKGEDKELFFQNNPSTASEAFVATGYSFFQMRNITKNLNEILEENPDLHTYACYRYEYGNRFFDLKMEFLDPDEHDREYMDRATELRVWEEPKDDGRYVIGMDPSYADDHGDYAVISVWRCYADCLVQVAEYATNKIEPVRTAWVLAHLAGVYRDCIMNLELQGGGTNVMQELDSIRGQLQSDLHADQVRSRDWEDALGWARWYLYHRPDSMGSGFLNNFKANYDTKHTMMYGFQGCFSTKQLTIHSVRLLYDMQNVRVEGNSICAPESSSEDCKDDRVIAAALACKAWMDWRRNEMIALGLTWAKAQEQAAGGVPAVPQRLNNLVYRFMQTEQQRHEEARLNPVPTWREQRGL